MFDETEYARGYRNAELDIKANGLKWAESISEYNDGEFAIGYDTCIGVYRERAGI